MLDSVKQLFRNGFTNPNYVIKVTGLTMDASQTATYDLTGESNDKGVWTQHSSLSTNLDFGTIASIAEGASEECAQERLTFPTVASKEYTVNIKAELWIGEVLGKSIEKTAKITGLELEQGKAYNFTAEFNASNFVSDKEEEEGIVNYPIVFEANVIDWVDAEIGILGVGGEITENYTMITDASASSMITLADDKEFDGAGHTLTIGGEPKDFYTGQTLRLIQTKGDATISNLTIDGENTSYEFDGNPEEEGVENYGIRGIFMTGEGTVEGYTYEQDGVTPIAGVTVTFTGNNEFGKEMTGIFTSDENGYYTGSLFVGTYSAVASVSNYQDAQVSGVNITYDTMTSDVNFNITETYNPVYQVNAEEIDDSSVNVYWSWDKIAAEFELIDFETGDFSQADFNNGVTPDYPWVITETAYEGNYAIKSTCEGVSSGQSIIEITVDVPEDGVMSYYHKVSSEQAWDLAGFYIDNVQMTTASGEVDWTYKEFPVSAGTHTYSWRYVK